MLGRGDRAATQDLAELRSLADLIEQLDGGLPVPELGDPGLHRQPERVPSFDRVQTQVIAQPVHLRDCVQLIDL